MPNYTTEVRYAVARDNVQTAGRKREWWQLRADKFDTEWWERRTFERKASALAVIWKYRDQDSQGNYKYTLFKVVRRYVAPTEMMQKTSNGGQEARVP